MSTPNKVPLDYPQVRATEIPAREKVKFYQVGSYAVGNRLAEEQLRSVQSDPDRYNSLTSGHRACQGCGEALGARYALDTAMRAADKDLVAVNATGCLEVFSTPYPETSWTIPWLHSLFGNAPAVASGVAAAMKAKGKKTRVVAQGGDGGTVDIGMGSLSGMLERNDDVLYICYDNEAYMNTGVQRSGATPPAARTATTQPVGEAPGNNWGQGKDMARIAMAHEIPYVATATVADLRDLEYKVSRAMEFHGARYIHVLVPCPLGWGSAANNTIKVARLAVQSGLFPVYEAEYGEVTSVMKLRQPTPVEEYLKLQRRFAHLFKKGADPEVIRRLQAQADRNIRRYNLVDDEDFDLATEHFVEFEQARYGFRKPVGQEAAVGGTAHGGDFHPRKPISEASAEGIKQAAEEGSEQTASDPVTDRFSANPQTVKDSSDSVKAGEGAGEASTVEENK
ncbi:MAG: thiamine pyrophosphate-dependent enzyme [Actinomycetaceae bacterium]|nr:thiamine pyrophosphate-dependent enzyme [Actinomycetaceae bacterium]